MGNRRDGKLAHSKFDDALKFGAPFSGFSKDRERAPGGHEVRSAFFPINCGRAARRITDDSFWCPPDCRKRRSGAEAQGGFSRSIRP